MRRGLRRGAWGVRVGLGRGAPTNHSLGVKRHAGLEVITLPRKHRRVVNTENGHGHDERPPIGREGEREREK